MQAKDEGANYQGLDQTDDSEQGQFVDQLTAEAIEYIHGTAKDEVLSAVTDTDNTGAAIGATTYKITAGLLDKHKKEGMAMDIEMDVVMGVATEVIDMLAEILEATQPDAIGNGQKLREDALLQAMMMHTEKFEGDDRAKEEAEVMLRGMVQDGTADKAFNYVNKRAAEEGVNTNDMQRQGNTLLADSGYSQNRNAQQERPVAAGVRQGLMEQS